MSKATVTLANGLVLPLEQAFAISDCIALAKASGHCHWHPNDCGCCYTVHGADFAWVVGADGGKDFFAGKGCDCPAEPDGGSQPAA
jgi:hypothetical protein